VPWPEGSRLSTMPFEVAMTWVYLFCIHYIIWCACCQIFDFCHSAEEQTFAHGLHAPFLGEAPKCFYSYFCWKAHKTLLAPASCLFPSFLCVCTNSPRSPAQAAACTGSGGERAANALSAPASRTGSASSQRSWHALFVPAYIFFRPSSASCHI